jgi:hypothetical protein
LTNELRKWGKDILNVLLPVGDAGLHADIPYFHRMAPNMLQGIRNQRHPRHSNTVQDLDNR